MWQEVGSVSGGLCWEWRQSSALCSLGPALLEWEAAKEAGPGPLLAQPFPGQVDRIKLSPVFHGRVGTSVSWLPHRGACTLGLTLTVPLSPSCQAEPLSGADCSV